MATWSCQYNLLKLMIFNNIKCSVSITIKNLMYLKLIPGSRVNVRTCHGLFDKVKLYPRFSGNNISNNLVTNIISRGPEIAASKLYSKSGTLPHHGKYAYESSTQFSYDFGLLSATLSQRHNNIGLTPRICWKCTLAVGVRMELNRRQ